RGELVNMAFRELVGGTLASAATAAAFALALATRGITPTLLVWLGVMTVITFHRLWLAAGYRRAAPRPEERPGWALHYIITTTISGLAWGTSVWIFPTVREGGPFGSAHVLVLAGLVTGSARLLLPLRK